MPAFQAGCRGFKSRRPLQRTRDAVNLTGDAEIHVSIHKAHVAQLAEHVLGKDEVTRSIRVVGSSTSLKRH